jgi:hypothetical protein
VYSRSSPSRCLTHSHRRYVSLTHLRQSAGILEGGPQGGPEALIADCSGSGSDSDRDLHRFAVYRAVRTV